MPTRAVSRRIPLHAASKPGDSGVEQLARWLDSAFTLPGTNIRFGLDSLLGLLPGAGDTLTSLVSLYILSAAHRRGASKATILRMALNVAIDFTIGAIPVLGDLFDLYFKSNQRNVALLQRHLAATPGEQRQLQRGDRWFVTMVIVALALILAACVYAAVRSAAWAASYIFA
jgi:hypothetical protein